MMTEIKSGTRIAYQCFIPDRAPREYGVKTYEAMKKQFFIKIGSEIYDSNLAVTVATSEKKERVKDLGLIWGEQITLTAIFSIPGAWALKDAE